MRYVLAVIGFGEQAEATASVTDDGHWSLGVLRGAWSKPEVEFPGAGARQRTRHRRLTELLSPWRQRSPITPPPSTRPTATGALRDGLEALPGTLPPADAVVRSGQDVPRGRAWAGGHRAPAMTRTSVAPRPARVVANRIAAELANEAGGDGLPTGVDALDILLSAVGELRQALGEHRRALDALAGHHERLGVRDLELVAREVEAAHAASRRPGSPCRARVGRPRAGHVAGRPRPRRSPPSWPSWPPSNDGSTSCSTSCCRLLRTVANEAVAARSPTPRAVVVGAGDAEATALLQPGRSGGRARQPPAASPAWCWRRQARTRYPASRRRRPTQRRSPGTYWHLSTETTTSPTRWSSPGTTS